MELSDDCWLSEDPQRPLDVGDVFEGVALPQLDTNFGPLLSPDDRVFLPATFSLALVVGRLEQFVVLAPITTEDDVDDVDRFRTVVEQGREVPYLLRLPVLDVRWPTDGLATLFQPTTSTEAVLRREPARRVASLSPPDRDILRYRFAEAWRGEHS